MSSEILPGDGRKAAGVGSENAAGLDDRLDQALKLEDDQISFLTARDESGGLDWKEISG